LQKPGYKLHKTFLNAHSLRKRRDRKLAMHLPYAIPKDYPSKPENMKKIILASAILIGISSMAAAQTAGGQSSNSTSVSSSTATPKKGKKSQKAAATTDSLNERKMYEWKDGQRATPTGHEATGTNGGYAAIGNDSTATRRDSTRQQ
jgi:hypothetical protein